LIESNKLAILKELLKNGRQSDREISRLLGISQPTVSRGRRIIECDCILGYTAIPILDKLGFEIMAFTFFNATAEQLTTIAKDSRVIFASHGGQGCRFSCVTISVHKENFADYQLFCWELPKPQHENFLIPLKNNQIIKHLSFKDLS
jgi:DNA-binding Lrp family transcriptional regulator